MAITWLSKHEDDIKFTLVLCQSIENCCLGCQDIESLCDNEVFQSWQFALANIKLPENKSKYQWFIPVVMGFMAFWAVCGFKILNPTYFGWLAANDDPFQHLIGWLFFKDSPWSFPLGLNPNFGLSISSSIVYSDSIPLFAFLFKPFAQIFF